MRASTKDALAGLVFLIVLAWLCAWGMAALCGCSITTYSDGKGRDFASVRVLDWTGIESAEIVTTDGGRAELRGYRSDRTRTIDLAEKVVDAALPIITGRGGGGPVVVQIPAPATQPEEAR